MLVGENSKKLQGSWDSIHVLEVQESKKTAKYKLTSTVMLNLITEKPATGNVNLSGSMTRQVFVSFIIDGTRVDFGSSFGSCICSCNEYGSSD